MESQKGTMVMIEDIVNFYLEKKEDIKYRIREFRDVGNGSEKRIFAELAFCICTPQSRVRICWNAIDKMMRSGILYEGGWGDVRSNMRGIRFANNKTNYILAARNDLPMILKFRNLKYPSQMRESLVRAVKGIGWKEYSHFLRNVGHGKTLQFWIGTFKESSKIWCNF